uniref:Uncharacterized protein n=1 Tax=Oryza sativa subsp. japonica TaxID=39947 RepID=Q6H6L4_ORYSJ|nr:hypothetical protein [Oryza sativa Japonica Group]BAD27678.1 hypothetical protein [Oryza sativa Japonica Group]
MIACHRRLRRAEPRATPVAAIASPSPCAASRRRRPRTPSRRTPVLSLPRTCAPPRGRPIAVALSRCRAPSPVMLPRLRVTAVAISASSPARAAHCRRCAAPSRRRPEPHAAAPSRRHLKPATPPRAYISPSPAAHCSPHYPHHLSSLFPLFPIPGVAASLEAAAAAAEPTRPAAAMCLVAAPCSAVDLAAASPSTPPPNW